jgi:Replication initiator protein, pSAM2
VSTPTLPIPGLTQASSPEVRPGSRAARLRLPRAIDALKTLAEEYGVCVRPVTLRRTDLGTGETELIDLPCGATREDKCPPCAKRAKRLRQVQIREGWHRTDEPNPGPDPATEEQKALIRLRAHFEYERADAERNARWDQVADLDAAIQEVEEAIAAEGLRGRVAPPHNPEEGQEPKAPKKKRSTRRRQDAPDLPRQKVQARTVGRTYTAPDGTVHQPSMWLTLTLDSYGHVHGQRKSAGGKPIPCPCRRTHAADDPLLGVPVDPGSYDYRRAAWDAVHFARLLDRYWQNLRRCVGWNVQYAGCVEPQRRLAPHAHFAIRGTIPRATLEKVAAATYHQVWWPTVDQPRYTPDRPPVWDADRKSWVDPERGETLTTWADALATIDADPDAEPAHVVRFGGQVKAKGVTPGSKDVDRTIGYITKYVTKNAADCHTITTDPQRDHLDRLWHQLRVTPCSDRCANWLLYGIQPKKAHGKLRPGNCKGRVHQKATLGLGGRRVLVSRDWSGKTLADHRADAKAWVRALLGVTAGHEDHDQADAEPGQPAPVAWELARPGDPDMQPLEHRLLRGISQRIQWRDQINKARERAGHGPPGNVSATATAIPINGEE